jgi:hypothetical protein
MGISPESLSDEALEDIRALISLDEKDRQEILKIYSKLTEETSLSEIKKDVVRMLDEPTLAAKVERAILGTSSICKDADGAQVFLKRMKESLNKEQFENLTALVSDLKSKGIINGVFRYFTASDLRLFGLPHFVSAKLVTDYRILTDLEGKKRIVPMFVWAIYLHAMESDDEEISSPAFTFQMSPRNLNILTGYLEEFESDAKRDIQFMKDKLLH